MSLMVIDRDRKFHKRKLFPFVPHHKDYIERALLGMSLTETDDQKRTFEGFKKYYLSFGIPLRGLDDPPTFENARDEEKLLAGWERGKETGVLEPPKKSEPVKVPIEPEQEPPADAAQVEPTSVEPKKKGKK